MAIKKATKALVPTSLRTTLCLLYPPKIIALAAIHIAAKYLDENLNEGLGDIWRELFEPDVQDILGTIHRSQCASATAVHSSNIGASRLIASFNTDAANEILDQYTQVSQRGGRSMDKVRHDYDELNSCGNASGSSWMS